MSDPYQVLGVPRGSSEKEIESARHALFALYHPVAGSEPDAARWKQIEAAFQQLKSHRSSDTFASLAPGADDGAQGTWTVPEREPLSDTPADDNRAWIGTHGIPSESDGMILPVPGGWPWRPTPEDLWPPTPTSTPLSAWAGLLLSLVLCAPLGLLFSSLAIRTIRNYPTIYHGVGLAYAGILLSLLPLLVGIVIGLLYTLGVPIAR